VTEKSGNDFGLETLLELDGEVFPMDNGYWTKFEARRVEPSEAMPHGIKYSLTLHDKQNVRIIGYDNAHAIPKSKKYSARRVVWDHKHEREIVKAYEFESAGQLMDDFWRDVNRIIGNEK
jgi:hypothetical protein